MALRPCPSRRGPAHSQHSQLQRRQVALCAVQAEHGGRRPAELAAPAARVGLGDGLAVGGGERPPSPLGPQVPGLPASPYPRHPWLPLGPEVGATSSARCSNCSRRLSSSRYDRKPDRPRWLMFVSLWNAGPAGQQPFLSLWAGVQGCRRGALGSHLCGDQLEDQLAVTLHPGGARARFQLEPAVLPSHRHLLGEGGSDWCFCLMPSARTDCLWDCRRNRPLLPTELW